MKKIIGLLAILVVLAVSACNTVVNTNEIQGSGKVISEDRAVSGVQGVNLEMSGELTVKLGDQESLVVTGDDNLMSSIETSVSGGTLTIRHPDNTNLRPTQTLKYDLTVKSVDSLATSSSGNITAPELQATQMRLNVSSSGGIHLAGIQANTLNVSISSSGNIRIDGGAAQQQTITISSSGSYDGGDVQGQSANVTISSSGNATVWLANSLNAHISSSGNVNYYGNPTVSQNISSSGKLISLGNK